MKRYNLNRTLTSMETHTNGEFVRFEDIKRCFRPIPDGEPCTIRELEYQSKALCLDAIGVPLFVDKELPHGCSNWCVNLSNPTKHFGKIGKDAVVQPIRFEEIEGE